jgi:hypothetical protein
MFRHWRDIIRPFYIPYLRKYAYYDAYKFCEFLDANNTEAQNLLGCTVMFLMNVDRRFRGACSETSVDIRLRTRQYIPEDSELHTRRRENLISH